MIRRSVVPAESLEAPGEGAGHGRQVTQTEPHEEVGKSLKEKRADKHAKADAKAHPTIIPPGKGH